MAYRLLTEEGRALDAHFDLEGTQIIIHSRGGGKQTGTNTEYGEGLRLLLKRVRESGIRVVDAWVDSSTVQHLAISERRIVEN